MARRRRARSRRRGSASSTSRARSTACCWCRMRAAGCRWRWAASASARGHLSLACRGIRRATAAAAVSPGAVMERGRGDAFEPGVRVRSVPLRSLSCGRQGPSGAALSRRRTPTRPSSCRGRGPEDGARPDQHAGQRPRARRTRGCGSGDCRPPFRAAFASGSGDELLTAGFPRHSRRRPRERVRRRGCVEIDWSPPGIGRVAAVDAVGKGVCFDSGGLDIKPGSGMALMKKDMGGAAVALALANMLMHARVGARAAGADSRRGELDQRQRLPARRRPVDAQGPHRRGRQYGCRRAPGDCAMR